MTLMRDDHVDIGVLVAWALRPNQRPGRSPDYQRVLDRYRTVAEFRAAADAVLHGLGATVLSDGDFGLVLGVAPESPLAFRVTDMPGQYKSDHKVHVGLILTGLAAFAYPSAHELDEDRLRPVAVADFDNWLRDLCERLRSHDAGGEVIPEEGLDARMADLPRPARDRPQRDRPPDQQVHPVLDSERADLAHRPGHGPARSAYRRHVDPDRALPDPRPRDRP